MQESIDILRYIPQRPPMVMVDALHGVSNDERQAQCGLTIQRDNIFCNADGVFAEAGLLEHAAQSAALRVGYICQRKGEPVPLGFIGSFNKVHINALPHVGDVLCTTINIEYEVMGIVLTSFEIKCNDVVLAQGQMKVALRTEA